MCSLYAEKGELKCLGYKYTECKKSPGLDSYFLNDYR